MHQPSLDQLGAGALDLPGAEQAQDRAVGSRLAGLAVAVEAAAVLPTQPAGVDHALERVSRLHPVPVGRVHDLGGLARDVEPDLVEQGDRPDREAERQHRLVDRLDRTPSMSRIRPASLM